MQTTDSHQIFFHRIRVIAREEKKKKKKKKRRTARSLMPDSPDSFLGYSPYILNIIHS